MYGRAEEVVGDLTAASGVRDRLFLASKVWTRGHDAGVRQVENSLKRMGGGRMDLMQVHNLVDLKTQLATLRKLKEAGVDRIVAAPLYPQYTQSSFETAVAETRKQSKKLGVTDKVVFLNPFYVDQDFIQANAKVVSEHLQAHSTDHVLFSFHSVPVRHIKQIDTNDHCRVNDSCCAEVGAANANCYRAQCHATSRAIAAAIGLSTDQYTTCFQSQFGKDEWIGPPFEGLLEELPKRGIKTVAVACPSFVADCLETLEEIGIRGREEFQEAGGEDLTLIPCLNSEPVWIKAAANLIRRRLVSPLPLGEGSGVRD